MSTISWPHVPSHYLLFVLSDNRLPNDAQRAVFQAIIINRLGYASPAWWGFTFADNRNCLETFLHRSAKLGYCANSSATFASICADADHRLFTMLSRNRQHLLHLLLPPEREQHYSFRDRSHNYQLSDQTSTLNDNNFIIRMLYNY